jgi:uncharacterized protein (TIGR03790 family)
MKTLCWLFLGVLAMPHSQAAPAPIQVENVAVLFNSSLPESEALAKAYQQARGIPEANMIGLAMPDAEEITREVYLEKIHKPLRDAFDKRSWWKRGKTPDGMVIAGENKIQVMVCMRGVPLKISRQTDAPPKSEPGKAAPAANPLQGANEAAVDSEIAVLSLDGYPLNGPTNNQYFQSKLGFAEAKMPFLILVGRIDGPTFAVCHRMIDDAITAEKNGLWGRAYFDIANFYPEGDTWIRGASAKMLEAGFPVIVNPWKEVFAKNYPMGDAAVYYGWYEGSVCGPFVKPGFAFRKGAVAVHLHSFSASTLRSETANWCGPLLARGAAATLGNVYEPYLAMTHHFDDFQQHLLDGFTLVEAAYASIPVVSWQGVVLGDPLYRPFLRLDGSGEKLPEDRVYRALRVARVLNADQDSKYLSEIERVGHEKQNSVFLESLGLIYLARKQTNSAERFIREAMLLYKEDPDRLRCQLHLAGIDRDAGRISQAVKSLREAETLYAAIPEIESVRSLLAILDPPPPPPVQPAKK